MAWLDILKLAKSPIQQAYEKYKPTVVEALGKGQEFIDRTSGYSSLPEEARRAVDMAVDYSPIGGTIVGKGIKGLNTIEDIAEAEIKSRPKTIPTIEPKKSKYMSGHMAPTPEGNAPGYDVSQGIYPKDFYSAKGVQYYGDGQPYDYKSWAIINSIKNKPNAPVIIYRSVPNNVGSKINPGDWVTINRKYAIDHGESNLGGKGNYKIISKKVTAKDIYTDGNSIHEWGYAPQERTLEEIPFKYMDVRSQRNLAGELAREYINPNIQTRFRVPYTDEKFGRFGFPPPEIVNLEVEKIREALIKAEEFLDN